MRAKHGFTLLELSIVLVVIGILLAISVSVGTGTIENARQAQTRMKMDRIEEALDVYFRAHGRLPCPAGISYLPGGTSPTVVLYGVGLKDSFGNCEMAETGGRRDDGNFIIEGAVPAVDLNLPLSFMDDAWGRHLFYVVDTRLAEKEASDNYRYYESCSGLTVNDETGAPRTSTAVYVLYSVGENGHGGYTPLYPHYYRIVSGAVDTDERENCSCSSAISGFYDGAYDTVYVQKPATDTFDDIVRFKERWQLYFAGQTERDRYVGPELMLAHVDAPYVSFYAKNCRSFTKINDPADLPGGTGNGVAVSPNNIYWVLAHDGGDYVTIYTRDVLTGAMEKSSTLSTAIPANANGVAFSPDGNYLAVAHDMGAAATLTVYKVDTLTGVFTYLDPLAAEGPLTQPPAVVSANTVAFHPGGKLLAVGHEVSPFITMYSRTGDVFTAIATATVFPGGAGDYPEAQVNHLTFSQDGKYLLVASSVSDEPWWYSVNGDTGALTRIDISNIWANIPIIYGSFERNSRYLYIVTNTTDATGGGYRMATASGSEGLSGLGSFNITLDTAAPWDARTIEFFKRSNYIFASGNNPDYGRIYKYVPGTGSLEDIDQITNAFDDPPDSEVRAATTRNP